MSRVLFVAKELVMEPLGIMYLSSALKMHGHEIGLARCDFGPDPADVVRDFQPHIVCYSVCSGLEDFYFDLNRRLGKCGDFRSVFGGPSVTFNPFQYRAYAYVQGEGEKQIARVVEGHEPKHCELIDVNNTPWPDRELVYQFNDLHGSPIKNVISRRGCRQACSYCFNREWNKLHRDQLPEGVVRHRDPEHVVSECAHIRNHWPVRMVNFVDDNFVTSTEWLEKFAWFYPDRVGLPFFCSVRPDDVDDHKMQLIAEAGGAVINMAIECANDENRKRVLTRVGTKEAVLNTLRLVRKYGMRSRLQNIIGLPVDDPLGDAYETLDFNIQARPTSSWCAILQAYPGTEVYEMAYKGGYIDPNRPGPRTDTGFFGCSTLEICDRRKIERLHKLWPLVTRFSWLRRFVPVMIRVPLPLRLFRWLFSVSKRWLCEKELWKVFNQ